MTVGGGGGVTVGGRGDCGWRGWGDWRCSRQVSVDRLCTDTFTSVQTCLVLALLLTDQLISGSDDHAFGSLFLSPSDV